MAHQRSPNCPQISFVDAAEKGRLIYNKEHTHPAAKEVIATSLGYSGINGRSLSMIGALRQYGILDGSGEAMRISDAAVAYFELPNGPERQEAIEQMIFAPNTFAQINAAFGETLPSEQNLKHHLIKQGFLPKAAEDVIAVYRENIRLLENTSVRYNEEVMPSVDAQANQPTAFSAGNVFQSTVNKEVTSPMTASDYTFPLGRGAFADVRIRGDVTPKSLGLLRSQIELLIEALTDSDDVPPNPSNEN